ncbi:Organic solute transporter subunit beta [Galemys pyrenaicus]|uniref:Organic solute transporter subunit beta n=1 Tax=Galemys pyrenaicus TaxID=202257 RepID=A0A8J5ZVR1_GALPY|nr:Organic solute transporter subunit beta [Galemys pyrenaicus]
MPTAFPNNPVLITSSPRTAAYAAQAHALGRRGGAGAEQWEEPGKGAMGSPWNYSMFALTVVVVTISIFLLVRSIRTNRNKKMMPREKQTPGVPYSDEEETKDYNSQNLVTETLPSVKLNLTQMEIELKESNVSSVLLPEPEESES